MAQVCRHTADNAEERLSRVETAMSMNRWIRALGAALSVAAGLVLAGCTGGGGDGGLAAPVIAMQPADTSVASGQTASFSVVATASPAPSYQWQRNGADIAGATSASYVTPAVALADGGARYTVAVSNSQGTVGSNAATLGVTAVTAAEKRSLLNVLLLTAELYLAGFSPYFLTESWAFVEPTTVCLTGTGSAMLNGVPATPGQEVPTAATVSATYNNCMTAEGTRLSGSASVSFDFPLFDLLANTATATVTSNNMRYTSSSEVLDFTANGSAGFVASEVLTPQEDVATIVLTPGAGSSVRDEATGLAETFASGSFTFIFGIDGSANTRARLGFDNLSSSISGVAYLVNGFIEMVDDAQGTQTAGSGEIIFSANGTTVGRIYATAGGIFVDVDGVALPTKLPKTKMSRR